ncbi:MAG: hypothetical protein RR198_08325 [Oscillospiraceae bacterium]
MKTDNEKYNDIRARNIALSILQNHYNSGRGLEYQRAVKLNPLHKGAIDFWLGRYRGAIPKDFPHTKE